MVSALTRILAVDEHPVSIAGLARIVASQPDWTLSGADAGEIAARGPGDEPADLVVLEPAVRGLDGLGLIAAIAARVPVLCLSSLSEEFMAERALREGARGYVMKTSSPDEIVEAIRTVLGGGIALSECVRRHVITRFAGLDPLSSSSNLAGLNNRELQIVHLIGANRSSRQIAAHLRVSEKTVATHRTRIREKLQFRTATDLARAAARWFEHEGLS